MPNFFDKTFIYTYLYVCFLFQLRFFQDLASLTDGICGPLTNM